MTAIASHPQALVATADSVDAFGLLQRMAPSAYDASRLLDTAAIAYVHVDGAAVAALRARFVGAVRAQFQARPWRFRLERSGSGFCQGFATLR